jgi:hypothetical protein
MHPGFCFFIPLLPTLKKLINLSAHMMRLAFICLCCSLFQTIQAQYKIDPTIKTKYLRLFERLPQEIKEDKSRDFKNGLSVLTGLKTDTLNKKDLEPMDTSVVLESIVAVNEAGGPIEASVKEDEPISESNPRWLSCSCVFKKDTLVITSAIALFSGFAVVQMLYNNKNTVRYEAYEREEAFKTKLTNEKVFEMNIPASINSLVIDRKPEKGIKELYGSAAITTNGYYYYMNVWRFKNDYIYQRKKIQFYFKCSQVR